LIRGLPHGRRNPFVFLKYYGIFIWSRISAAKSNCTPQ
jgi:hypothetical protein